MGAKSPNNNQRIAKNTFFLYGKKILSLSIGLFTSRVLLQTLGVDDFGLYGLIGSIVGLFTSLRSMFASSIQRFLNTESQSSLFRQNQIFSTGVLIHYGIAVLFTILVEITGLLMLPTLNFAPDRITTAFWVLQFSILSTIITILTIPYDALMMAKERFDIMAGFSLLESVLKLGAIYLLTTSPFDRVVFYSFFIFIIGVTIRLLSILYCRHQFKQISKVNYTKDRELLTGMTKFAGWNFVGSLGLSATTQGLNFILNIFGGVVSNAARTIAYAVNDHLRSFVTDLATAFTPQSMMAYHTNKTRFYSLQFFSTKACVSVFLILVFPIYLMTEPIISFWLGECPKYTVSFIHGIIFYSIIRNLRIPIDTTFKSANKMKLYQICEFTLTVINLPLSGIALYKGLPLYYVFTIMAILELINLIVILGIANSNLNFPTRKFLMTVLFRCGYAISILAGCYMIFFDKTKNLSSLGELAMCAGLGCIASLAVCITVVFNHSDRMHIYQLVKNRL